MGTCGAPSSFLCVARTAAATAAAATVRRCPTEISPSGRFVHLWVILMLFQRFARPEFSGFAEAILQCQFYRPARRAGPPRCLGKPVKGLGEHSSLAGHDAPG